MEDQIQNPEPRPAYKIMVVDDELKNMNVLLDYLIDFNYYGTKPAFITYKNSNDAIAELDKTAERGEMYAVIILDYYMPPIHGNQVIDHLRINLGNELTQIIMLTAYAGDGKVLPDDPITNLVNMKINDFIKKDPKSYERVAVSLFNSLRIFESLVRVQSLLKHISLQNAELQLVYSLLLDFFSDKTNSQLQGPDQIDRIIYYLLAKLSELRKKEPPKNITQEAKNLLHQQNNLDFGLLFELIDMAVQNDSLEKIHEGYIQEWINLKTNNMIWNHDKLAHLNPFYNQLVKFQMIRDCGWEHFKDHFTGGLIPFGSILWYKTEMALVYMFFELERFNYLEACFKIDKFRQLSEHFEKIKKDGSIDQVNYGSIRSMSSKCDVLDDEEFDRIYKQTGKRTNPRVWICVDPYQEIIDQIIENIDEDPNPQISGEITLN